MSTTKEIVEYLETLDPSLPLFISFYGKSLLQLGRPSIFDGMWTLYDPNEGGPTFIQRGEPKASELLEEYVEGELEIEEVGYLVFDHHLASKISDWISASKTLNAQSVIDLPLFYSGNSVLFFGEAKEVNVTMFSVKNIVFNRESICFVESTSDDSFPALVLDI